MFKFKYNLTCVILTICLILRNCKGLEKIFLNNTAFKFYCGPSLYHKEHQMSKQAVFYIADNHSDTYLDDCLLTKRNIGTTAMLLRDNDNSVVTTEHIKKYPNVSPIIVLVIPNLKMKIVYHSITKYWLQSHRSTVYIVITTKDTAYGCDNGVFSKEVLKTIEEFLNRIWHEYKIFMVVAEFPFVCPEYFVVYDDKRKSKHDLYDRTISTIPVDALGSHEHLKKDGFQLTKGYPVRANIFKRFPTSIIACENMHFYLKVDPKYTNWLCGMDAFVMHDILRHHQFNTTFPKLTDEDGYGFAYRDNVTGSLGQLLRNEFDISFNSRFMAQYLEKDEINFIHYVSFDSICAVLKIPDYLPLWYYTYYFLRPSAWGVLICMMILSSITNKISIKVLKSMGKETNSSNIIDLIMIGVFGWYYNKKLKASILGGICLLTSVIFCACFQGHVNYIYTALVRYDRVATLEQLHRSNVKIYTSRSFYKLLGSEFQSEKNIVKINKNTGDVLKDSQMATLQRKSDIILEIRRDFSDEDGWPLIYIVKECYSNMFLSYITRKDFPFTTEIKIYMMRLLESGLPDAYYQFTQHALQLSTMRSFYEPKSKPRPFTPTNMPELRVAFCFLCVGYFVSTIALVTELWWARRSRRESIQFSL